jgi:hypothetical protein
MEAETIEAPDLARAEARLPRWMVGVAAVSTVAVLAAGHVRIAAGFALGAAVAILNYCWLHQAVVALLGASLARVPRRLILKIAVRYPLAFAGVYLFYRTGWLPFAAVMAGLFVPVGGILIEAVIQIRDGLRGVERPARPRTECS